MTGVAARITVEVVDRYRIDHETGGGETGPGRFEKFKAKVSK